MLSRAFFLWIRGRPWLLGVLVFLCLSQFPLLFTVTPLSRLLFAKVDRVFGKWLAEAKACFYDVRVSGRFSISLGVTRNISIAARTP